MAELTDKQRRFVDEYLVDLNATQAAIRAGYASGDIGRQLLTKTHVSDAIARAQSERSERTGISADRVLNELALIAFSSVEHYAVNDDGTLAVLAGAPDGAERAVSSRKRKFRLLDDDKRDGDGAKKKTEEVETEVKLWDKLRALEMIGKHVRLFIDQPPPKDANVNVTVRIDAFRKALAELAAEDDDGGPA